MAEASIPVDLRNPGQVFACLGLMEAAEVLLGPVEGGYTWENGASAARFTVAVSGNLDPVREVVRFLATAEVLALNAPTGSAGVVHSTEGWGVATQAFDTSQPEVFPFKPPESLATLPIRLVGASSSLPISSWGDDPSLMGRDNVKFWAGSKGKPGAAFAQDALRLIKSEPVEGLASDPFGFSALQPSSFGLDWRRSYVPLDAGFSPNTHKGRPIPVIMVGYPLVELLAAIGLENARPERPERDSKLVYQYTVCDARLPLSFARAVLGGAELSFNVRRFRMQLSWPGKEDQARCIIDSREE